MLLSGVWIMQDLEEIDPEAAWCKNRLGGGGKRGIQNKVCCPQGFEAGVGKLFD